MVQTEKIIAPGRQNIRTYLVHSFIFLYNKSWFLDIFVEDVQTLLRNGCCPAWLTFECRQGLLPRYQGHRESRVPCSILDHSKWESGASDFWDSFHGYRSCALQMTCLEATLRTNTHEQRRLDVWEQRGVHIIGDKILIYFVACQPN